MITTLIGRTGKRERLAQALNKTNILSLFQLISSKNLIIINYHRITDPKKSDNDFNHSMFGPTPNELRRELTWMKECGTAISEADLIAYMQGNGSLPRNSFMVTFDDGYRDNYELALPVLRELKIPAIFFIPTQAIEERTLGWWEHVYWYLKQTKRNEITLRGTNYQVPRPVTTLGDRFNDMLKFGTAEDNEKFLKELAAACEVTAPPKELCDKELMTWDQIRDCSSHGISIGAHTHSHRVLATLDVETQRQELTESKRLLEERLGHEVHSMAYPVGGYEHFNQETMELARQCGYNLAFSFLTGTNQANSLESYDIKRLDRQTNRSILAGVFAMPWLFGKRSCAIEAPLACAHNRS